MQINIQAYVVGSIEAVEFYKKAFGADLGNNLKNTDNTFIHAEIVVGNQTILSLSELDKPQPPVVTGNTMQFCVAVDSEEALIKAYNILKEGGKITGELGSFYWNKHAASLVDKFGIQWYIGYEGSK